MRMTKAAAQTCCFRQGEGWLADGVRLADGGLRLASLGQQMLRTNGGSLVRFSESRSRTECSTNLLDSSGDVR